MEEEFALNEIATAFSAEILRALRCAVQAVAADGRVLLPADIRISALLVGGSRSSGGEAFRLLDTAGSDRNAAESVEFHWSFDAPRDMQIVREHRTPVQPAQA